MQATEQLATFRYEFRPSRVGVLLILAFFIGIAVFYGGILFGFFDITFEGRREIANNGLVQLVAVGLFLYAAGKLFIAATDHDYGLAMTPEGLIIPRLGTEIPVPWEDVITPKGGLYVAVDPTTYIGVKKSWVDSLRGTPNAKVNVNVLHYVGGPVQGGKRHLIDVAAHLKKEAAAGWPSRPTRPRR
ncbi:MAG: hypothetical protein IT535_01495 [Bauldia sp.]|nr:hypothetical protein [Bauldia sp.]